MADISRVGIETCNKENKNQIFMREKQTDKNDRERERERESEKRVKIK